MSYQPTIVGTFKVGERKVGGSIPLFYVPSRLLLDGVALDLDDVIADVTIRHGRVDVYDSGSPSTFQATIENVARAFTRAFRVGASLVFYVRDGRTGGTPELARFTGKVTDGGLADDALTVIAVGRLSTLHQYTVGDAVDYPAETWSARITRIFAEAGLAAYLQLVAPSAANDPQLAARVAATDGAVTLDQYLDDLANQVGAAIADTPDGKILVQPISTRTLAGTFLLDPDYVTFVPGWVQVLPQANIVTVNYPAGSVTVQDASSVAFYGPRPVSIDTDFTVAADATARANDRLARSAWSHWNIPSAPYLLGAQIGIGSPVTLTGMPEGSPYATWQPILEGWQDSITGDGHELDWTMELALSDPVASGLSLPWNGVPTTAAYQWNTIHPTVAWKDALQLGDLDPV